MYVLLQGSVLAIRIGLVIRYLSPILFHPGQGSENLLMHLLLQNIII